MNLTLYESFDSTLYIKEYYDINSHGFVVIHRTHGMNEIKGNKIIALTLAKLGYRIVLQPNFPNARTPDASINEEIWEFKTIWQATNLKNRVQLDIKNGKEQATNILIFIYQRYNIDDIILGIYNAVKYDKREIIKKIGILFEDGKLIIIERVEVIDNSYRSKF
jgi:hypothetical protein